MTPLTLEPSVAPWITRTLAPAACGVTPAGAADRLAPSTVSCCGCAKGTGLSFARRVLTAAVGAGRDVAVVLLERERPVVAGDRRAIRGHEHAGRVYLQRAIARIALA